MLDQRVDGLLDHQIGPLTHCRQVIGWPRGGWNVVITHHRNVFWNAHVKSVTQHVEHMKSHVVVGDENSVWSLFAGFEILNKDFITVAYSFVYDS